MIDLSVVIVNYNVAYFLEQCLHSVTKAVEGLHAEILVVDNNSVDGSVAMVRSKFPRVHLLAETENLGFSKANNKAIKLARGRYVLLLNPDTLVEEDTFHRCLEYMDAHPKAGGLGVRMIDGRGRFLPESKRGLPTPAVAFFKISGLSALFPRSRLFGGYHLGYLPEDRTHEVPVLSGAYMWLRQSVLQEIGLLDEAFFMYGEDIDLSYRITLAGYVNVYYPHARIIHYKGESTKKSSINYVVVFYRAMLIFAAKHFSARHARSFNLLISLAIYLRAGIAIAHRFARRVALPLLDATLVLGGVWAVKHFYQAYSEIRYDDGLVLPALVAYTAAVLCGIWLSGGYRLPVSIYRILRGVLAGSILALAIYSLLPEEMRFSRAILLLGTASSLAAVIALRVAAHLLGIRGYHLSQSFHSRVGIVAGVIEYNRILNLQTQGAALRGKYFRIATPTEGNTASPSAGRLKEVVEVFQPDILIFSAEDLSSQEIIALMAGVERKGLEFKIAPPESMYIIGSNAVEKSGELFMMDVNAVNKAGNRRAKRRLDVLASLSMLVLLPLLLWVVHHKRQFLVNIFAALSGHITWVGYVAHKPAQPLPSLLPSVLNPTDRLPPSQVSSRTAEKLNAVYARDYSTRTDLRIMLAGIRHWGRVARSLEGQAVAVR